MTKIMTASELNTHLTQLCRNERKITQEILTHINLFEKIGGHLKLGYSTLHQYLTRQLGYSDDQAQRRLKAARLLNQVPEVGIRIQNGTLNLSQAAEAQRAFELAQKENKIAVDVETKKTLINAIEKANNFETKSILARNLDLPITKEEKAKPQADRSVRLETTLTEAQFAKLKEIKSLLSHQIPDQNTGAVLEAVFDFFLEKKSPIKKEKTIDMKENVSNGLSESSKNQVQNPGIIEKKSAELEKNSAVTLETRRQCGKRSRYIPVKVKQSLFKRSNGFCEYVSPEGVRCQSRYKVQIDHRVPFCLGGPSTFENARHLCSSHNLMKATEQGIGFETTSYFSKSTN